jgi:triacylglycerol esterase/lipase EstA (alpha/beta hydrolase family)
LDTPAYANLTTDYCRNYFNPNTPDDPHVAYYSYGASTTLPVWSFLGLPNQWIREKEGDNDGLVSVESAKWGQYVKTLNTDHWSLNGQRYIKWRSSGTLDSKLDKFDTLEFYMELATYLYRQGH